MFVDRRPVAFITNEATHNANSNGISDMSERVRK